MQTISTRDLLSRGLSLERNGRGIRVDTTTNPSGTGSGCGNVKGFLDSYGTMTVNGSFARSLDYLLTSGFLADGHGAAYDYHYPTKAEIGIFTKVYEDSEGLQLEWEYHDDPHSQTVRQKTDKRLKNNKTCGLSIGFYVGDGTNPPSGWTYDPKETEPECDYIYVKPQFYEEVLNEYSAPQYLEENLERANANDMGIYILKHVHVFETSQTEIPANEVSLIAEVRSRPKHITMSTSNENRAKREEEDSKRAKLKDAKDELERIKRDLKNAKESHDDVSEHHAKLAKRVKTLASHLEDMGSDAKDDEGEDDKEEEEPKEKGKRSGSGRALFNGGR
jgi:hypothetical protein